MDNIFDMLGDLKHKAEEMFGGKMDLDKVKDVLSSDFIKEHTNFASLDELFKAGGFNIQSPEDFKKILGPKLDDFIKSNSKFDTFKDMVAKAIASKIKG